ncbi:hypothetical protein GQ53DRAFT_743795 [Thozetella sp. PMI_491]|nr:hypothetical protein GQ53DRAFT_743795 [Thozetella sp. PMI_491]
MGGKVSSSCFLSLSLSPSLLCTGGRRAIRDNENPLIGVSAFAGSTVDPSGGSSVVRSPGGRALFNLPQVRQSIVLIASLSCTGGGRLKG